MKKIILAVLVVLGFVISVGYNDASFAEERGQVILRTFKYNIQRGDNLPRIAKRFDTTKERLLWANEGSRCIKNENLILRGCKITIPDIVSVKEALRVLNEESRKAIAVKQKNAELKKANSKKSFLLGGVGIIAGFLFIGLLVIMIRTAAFKDGMEKDLEEKDVALKEKETALKGLELWRDGAVNQINNLKTKLSLKTEELSLQEGSCDEIKRLKTENDSLVLKLNECMTELDRTRIERGALYVELATAAYMPRFKTRSGQYIMFDTVKVRCKFKDCNTEVSPQNALSHYFQQHGKTKESELKETVDNA